MVLGQSCHWGWGGGGALPCPQAVCTCKTWAKSHFTPTGPNQGCQPLVGTDLREADETKDSLPPQKMAWSTCLV